MVGRKRGQNPSGWRARRTRAHCDGHVAARGSRSVVPRDRRGIEADLNSLRIDRDGRRMTFAAGPGASKEWCDATLAFPIGEPNGACEVAVRERRQVVVNDIAASPFFPETWRAVARRI